jgi:hypothetical protein
MSKPFNIKAFLYGSTVQAADESTVLDLGGTLDITAQTASQDSSTTTTGLVVYSLAITEGMLELGNALSLDYLFQLAINNSGTATAKAIWATSAGATTGTVIATNHTDGTATLDTPYGWSFIVAPTGNTRVNIMSTNLRTAGGNNFMGYYTAASLTLSATDYFINIVVTSDNASNTFTHKKLIAKAIIQ